ncbi:TPM domain-containing protein [Streptomyces sp. BI20]|uniref:TPM domain-containing protein n=1 Tax=Streptomyces sp. BI20 TaxID=3403460 RepID=UPI003C70E03B
MTPRLSARVRDLPPGPHPDRPPGAAGRPGTAAPPPDPPPARAAVRRARAVALPARAAAATALAAGLLLPATAWAAPGPGPAAPTAAAGEDTRGAGDFVLPVIAVGAAGALTLYALNRRRRGPDGTPRAQGTTGHGEAWTTNRPALPELDARAGALLVGTDDAVRTSAEELGVLVAAFGEERARPFTEALEHARGELDHAFRLRRQLDDAHPRDEATRRRMLDEIVARCAEANRRLDAEAGDFDRLRALEKNAPAALAEVRTRYAGLAGRVMTAQATVTALRERYADSASDPVAAFPARAEERAAFAETELAEAERSVAALERARAAVRIRAAEGAVDQAADLVDAVERRAREIAAAAGLLDGALIGTEADLAEARGLSAGAPPGADPRDPVGRAEAILARVREGLTAGRHDPIDSLRRVAEADAALDAVLAGAGAGEREGGDRREARRPAQALATARGAIDAAEVSVTTTRGAVGPRARTLLAEARRHLARAEAAAAGDPTGALGEAWRADALAREAGAEAERDLRAWHDPFDTTMGGRGRGSGGLGGAVLGGIVLDASRDERGGHGGFGAGDLGGSGRPPGSFGGSGTRGRLGDGGRF